MTTTTAAEIYSTHGADPELGELVEWFVGEMPNRIGDLERAFGSGDLNAVRRAAHQLKGAGGSYGFHQLTPLAASVEHAARGGEPEERIHRALEELLDACRRVRAGEPE